MKYFASLIILYFVFVGSANAQDDSGKPIKALLIAGGCCHDYAAQHKVLFDGIQRRANVQVDVFWTDDTSVNPPLAIYQKDDWADGYDVIIHDECAAGNKSVDVVKRILKAHQTIPSVHLHCAMHSFRTGTDLWFQHLGLASNAHGPQQPIEVKFVDTGHPITQGLANWTTENEELYNNIKVYDAHPLATGKQTYLRGGKQVVDEHIVAWTNEKQGARSFSTTLGHNTNTVGDDRYLNLVTRGLLWVCDKLEPQYMTPFKGNNRIRFNEGVAEMKAKAAAEKLGSMPKDATLVKISASSVQNGNEMIHVLDGDRQTRWCAENDQYPQWLMFEFQQPQVIKSVQLVWEFDKAYQYKIEGSSNGNDWKMLLDATNNPDADPGAQPLAESTASKFLRITGVGPQGGGWCSIRELIVNADGVKSLWPANPDKESFEPFAMLVDPFRKSGNIQPLIRPLTPEQEASILRDVQVADGFEATVFAAPPAVNYPVFVAAAPDGTLYVSSDGNGSLGRSPDRGRVIRLRDNDGDGRADETKVFCKVDAPRGLVWDHDRLYLMHPPHLSAFIDHDGDGIADQQKILVKNLAFGYDKRPADHTTNGLSIGVDGWLYIAGGDFGFIDAEGTDGRKLTHRGGGVIRVRPDGSGLELYSTGTRNILEVAISPRMDLFARDNTNDGGGWDVRFHHFTGGEDHGYPRLYKNFADECVPPLADYGGGSGCGAVYIDEPGFGDWNDAPFTADWGKGALYHHRVQPAGATFRETRMPEPFIRMTRPTDADVDAMSRLYCASWRGATFNWEGPDVGYIIRVRPKGFPPQPLPDFSKLSDGELVQLFDAPSHRRRLAAQRELLRRGNSEQRRLYEMGKAARSVDRNLAQRLQNEATDAEVIEALSHDHPVIVHIATRSLALRGAVAACFQALDDLLSTDRALDREKSMTPSLRALAMMHRPDVVDGLIKRLHNTTEPQRHQQILAALCRLHFIEGQWNGQSWGTRPDTRGPYYQPERWRETDKIAAVLKQELATLAPSSAAFLVREMNRNRISSRDALDRIIELARQDHAMVGDAVAQLASSSEVPVAALSLLVDAINNPSSSSATLADAVRALTKINQPDALSLALTALAKLDSLPGSQKNLDSARSVLFNSSLPQNHIAEVIGQANRSTGTTAIWADASLLAIATKRNASPESRELAQQAIDQAWSSIDRRIRFIQAAQKTRNHFLDDRIQRAMHDTNPSLAKVATAAANSLRLISKNTDISAKIKSLSVEAALVATIKMKGDIGRGEQLFTKLNCVACHTISKDVAQKGPYLGNIAQTYKRPDLAAAILQPSKTIAQGFATTAVLTADGALFTGFVTDEQADRVTLRDSNAKEFTIMKDEIEDRKTLPTSVMPDGLAGDHTVYDLASILDYLQSLSN